MRSYVVLALTGIALSFAGCMGKDPYNPGTPLGTFHVVGSLQTNTCGAPGTAPNPWEFDIKLAKDPGTLYWIQGGLPVQGALDAQSHAKLQATATQTVPADGGAGPCALVRDDALDTSLQVDPSRAGGVVGFSGTLVYTFSQTSDSDCSDALASNGGGYATLPCSIGYAIAGTRTALPKTSGNTASSH